jgi:hypothetical protein
MVVRIGKMELICPNVEWRSCKIRPKTDEDECALSGIPRTVANSTLGCGEKTSVDGTACIVSLSDVPAKAGERLVFTEKKNNGSMPELKVPVVENSMKELSTTVILNLLSCLS